MKTRPLIIGPEEDAKISKIVDYAKQHVVACNRLVQLSAEADPDKAIGGDPNLRMELPIGYRVVYNQEEQPMHGVCHHISISVNEEPTPTPPDKVLPNEIAVNMIMQAFGIKTTVRDALFIYIEPLDYGGGGAINIIEPLERKKV
jgi:hypothetical protein